VEQGNRLRQTATPWMVPNQVGLLETSIHRRTSLTFLRVSRGPAFKNARPTHKTKWRMTIY
jgi:hypothetical protein